MNWTAEDAETIITKFEELQACLGVNCDYGPEGYFSTTVIPMP